MIEQEFLERIAIEGVKLYNFPNLWNRLNESEKNHWRRWAKDSILPIVKEADYVKSAERGG